MNSRISDSYMNSPLSDQINALVAENRRLRNKSEADDATIALLKDQYRTVTKGIEDMVEDQRKIERELTIEIHNTRAADKEIAGLLNQVADLILQAARARIGDSVPANMSEMAHHEDKRLPGIVLS